MDRTWVLVGALIMVCSSSAGGQSSRWVNIAPADGRPILLDTTTATHRGHLHAVWVKYFLGSPRTEPASRVNPSYTYSSWTDRLAIDCDTNKLATLQSGLYDAQGDVVHSSDETALFIELGAMAFSAPTPESIGESVVRFVCIKY